MARALASVVWRSGASGLLSGILALGVTSPVRGAAVAYAAPPHVPRLTGAWPSTSLDAAPRYALRIPHEETARSVRDVLRRARQRLSRSTCQRLFDDFTDERGRSLRRGLDALGRSPAAYLELVIFYDGRKHPRCREDTVIAVTHVGSRAVFICPRQFARYARRNPRWVEATLIHEALHTLGLGENPPTSREITSAVMRRCL